MPNTTSQGATERSPLLGSPPEQAERPILERECSAPNGSANDVESNQQTEDTADLGLLQGRRKVKAVLPVLGAGIFLAFLDQSVVAAINGEIGSDLHALGNVSWIATAYFLTMTASQPLYGKFSDIFGRGLCVQSIGWRWIFLIQVFLCLIAIVSVALLLDLPKRQFDMPWRKQLSRIDILGALLLILVIFGLLFGLDRGSNASWRSPLTIGSLCAAIPLSIAFLVVETRFAVEPFTPGHVIFDKALFACYTQNFFGYAASSALIFYLPLYFQVILEFSPAQAGASLIPAAASIVVGALLGGITIKKTGKFYWLAASAATAATLGSIPLVVAPSLDGGSLASIYIGSIVGFVPQGVTTTASLIAIISNVSAADQAVATACSFLFRFLGAAVGVSLVGTLIQNVLRMRLRASLEPQDADRMIDGIAQSLDFIKDLPPPLRAVVRDCYNAGIQAGFAMCVALLAISMLSVFWWREKKLSK